MVDLEFLQAIGGIATAVATIALVIILFRTVKQLEATVVVSKVQTEYRFRPWIGPNNSIKVLPINSDGRQQFDVGIRNFGELPAEYVMAYFKSGNNMLSRTDLKSDNVEQFNLGPMLPNMEKHYWFWIDSEKMQKAKEGTEKIFTAIYFEYPVSGGKSGYGMISEYIPEKNGFNHKDMWVETPTPLNHDNKK